MSLSIAPRRIGICAYSGCFSGPVTLRRTRGSHGLYSAAVDGPGGRETASIILDREDGTALLRWGGFANAMRCAPDGPPG